MRVSLGTVIFIIVLVFGAATINVAGQSVQQRSKQSSSEILNVARNTLGGEAKLSSSATVGEQLLPHPNSPALAVTRFIKLFGMSFHGISRSPEAERATEAGPAALLAMVMPAVMCLLPGVLPTYAIGALDRAVQLRSRTPGRRKPLCRRFSRGVRVTTS